MAKAVNLVMLLMLVGGLCASALATDEEIAAWLDHKTTYQKEYDSPQAEAARYSIFQKNHRRIEEHNHQYRHGNATFKMRHNQHSDLTFGEFRKYKLGYVHKSRPKKSDVYRDKRQATLPASYDWRQYNYVTPIKDQGQCGSCFIFSALAALEGQVYAKTGTLPELGEQMLVDCIYPPSGGCNGGFQPDVWAYLNSVKQTATDCSYPYTGVKGKTCKRTSVTTLPLTSLSTVYVSASESALQSAMYSKGPISVAIDASDDSIQFYYEGIYTSKTCKNDENSLDHAVLVVGYGADDSGHPYWIIKNSWGIGWGDAGFLYLARNSNNMCGVATAASYPKY